MNAKPSKLYSALLAILLAITGVMSSPATPAHATTVIRFVGATCVFPGPACDGSTWSKAFATLQEALAVAQSGDQIWVAAGTYYPDEGTGQVNNDRNSTFTMKNGIAIYGGFAGTETQLSQRNPAANLTILSGDIDKNDVVSANGFAPVGNNAYHVVTAGTNNTAILDGFTIQQGNANGSNLDGFGGGVFVNNGDPILANLKLYSNNASSGGGMYISLGAPSLSSVTFTQNNSANDGGGMYNLNSQPQLTDVTFSNNTAIFKGGGVANFSSNPVVNGGTFSNNNASWGAGIFNEASSPSLTDVTFQANDASIQGGGMSNEASSPTLTGVTFTGNTAETGAGMYNLGSLSAPLLTNIIFDGNIASGNGGGMGNNFNALPTLTNVTFSKNQAQQGGGMYNDASSPILDQVTFHDNVSFFSGAGMYNLSSNPTLSNVTFSANGGGGDGGGMHNSSSNPSLVNVTFSGNGIDHKGGGMYNTQSSPALTNVTFSGNLAADGGGMFNNTNSSPTLKNTLIANSASGGDCVNNNGASLNPASSNNLIEDNADECSLVNGVNGNIIGQDPKLGALSTNGGLTKTHALSAGSPVIDKGTNSGCSSRDQRGFTRPLNGGSTGGAQCDIGAVEAPGILKVRSTAAQDGWALESAETGNAGGTMNNNAATLRLGDDAGRKQFRGILSFNTGPGLPDNAIITKITLKVKKHSISGGGNPVAAFQGFVVDVRKGSFGAANLQLTDWQTVGHKTVGPFNLTPVNNWYSINLINAKVAINKLASGNGLTQIRLRFKLDDNNNAVANFLSLFSGNAGSATSRPQLIVEYFVP